jgi:serine/threonine protein kinase
MIGAQVGQLVITRQLGEGGMGAVYLAEHRVLRTPRVVKVLLPQWTQNEMIVQRFVNEARAAASIQHRNIIAVHDCGQLANGSWFIIMDYLEGGTLARFCASQGGPLSIHVALQILAPIANGLEAAHGANIVHRDLKPDNIFLIQHDSNPHHPIILDFGIAKLGEQGNAVTKTGHMAGTPAYMAPEQMRDLRVVDRRSDVYALGLIAYQMVTGGWLPYQDANESFGELSAAEIYHRQMSRAPIDPRQHVASIPDRWAHAILAAINSDPARRPQTARAFAIMLAEATPADPFEQAGTQIVRTYARELLEIGNMLETVRGPMPVSMPPPKSRYQLGDRLGAGGMAEVFRGTMVGLEGFARPVAVKRVLPGFSTVPQFASMFAQEAQIASRLSHPNVVSVLDFDRDPDGRLFLVMEYVEGRDLASLVESGLLPFSVAIFVMSEALRGLGYAHDLPASDVRGVVHRDVSPHNVLLSWEGAVKVSDFGIAKAREASAVTASTMMKGKPSYMSPEQANGEELDGRSDLFAVGVMLWEILTGRRLFDGTTQETIAQVLFKPIPRPGALRQGVPSDLEAVTMRLLEREKPRRYPNAEAVIDDLARCADAPRNGRSELARLFAERFPQAIASRASRPQLQSDAHREAANATAPTDLARPAGREATPWDQQQSSTTLAGAASQSVIGNRGLRHRMPWIAGGVVVVAGVIGAIVFVASRKSESGSEERAPATTPSEVRLPPPLSVLTITTTPPAATIRVDGVAKGQSPVRLEVARGTRVVIAAEHDGFVPVSQSLEIGSNDQTFALILVAAPAVVDAGTPIDARAPTVIKSSRTAKPPRPASGSNSGSFNPNEVGGD